MLMSAKGYRRRELRAYANLMRRPSDDRRRLLIFAQGRTGSTVLEDLLCSTGYFSGNGELLGANGEGVRFAPQFLEGLARGEDDKHFICHVKIYQLLQDRQRAGARPVEPAPFLRKLNSYGWKIVHLKRKDMFRHFLSGQLARARGGYHKRDDTPEAFTFEIERRSMAQVMRRRARWTRREIRALKGIPHLTLTYEDNLQDSNVQQATVNEVLDFVDLEKRDAETRLRKINRRPLEETISNYSDVKRWWKEIVEEIEHENAGERQLSHTA